MPRTALSRSNCLAAVVYLALTGRLRGLAVVSSPKWGIVHLVGLTRRGHALHFQREYPQRPWWFVGRYEGVRRGRMTDRLRAEGRRVLVSFSVTR